MALPKWTDERTQQLTDFVGSESPITQPTVATQLHGIRNINTISF